MLTTDPWRHHAMPEFKEVMEEMLRRSIPYGLVLGLGTVVLAVLLSGGRPATNGDSQTSPGLGVAPAVLGAQSVPNTGPTTVSGNDASICPDHPYSLVQAGSRSNTYADSVTNTTNTNTNAGSEATPAPCTHVLAWVATPAPAELPNNSDHSAQGGLPWAPLPVLLALSSLAIGVFVLGRWVIAPARSRRAR